MPPSRLSATSAFAAGLPGFPVPSFNDAPHLYTERSVPQIQAQPRQDTGVGRAGADIAHPDRMHTSY